MPDVFHKVFPFHMAKGMQAMRGMVNNCDCIIEVRDARVPLSSHNPQFEYLYANKPRILLMNKIDTAVAQKTKVISENHVNGSNILNIFYTNCKSQDKQMFNDIMSVLKDTFRQVNVAKSMKGGKPAKKLGDRSYRVLVCGIPNVGKSSFINAARRYYLKRGGKATPVGRNPGVTRSVLQHIIISKNPRISILDTPGIISPQLDDPMEGIKLALTGTFPDHVIGEEVIADYLLYVLNQQENLSYLPYCGLNEPSDYFDDVIKAIAEKYTLYKGSEPDYRKSSINFIDAFRRGKLGPITLDDVT